MTTRGTLRSSEYNRQACGWLCPQKLLQSVTADCSSEMLSILFLHPVDVWQASSSLLHQVRATTTPAHKLEEEVEEDEEDALGGMHSAVNVHSL